VPLVTPLLVRNAGHVPPRHKGDIGSTTGTDMDFRARAGRLAGGLVVATALLGAFPGQALATSPTPAPAPPTAPVTTVPAESAPRPAAPATSRPIPPTESRQPQVRQVPAGAPDTGGGSAADDAGVPDGALLALGALAAAGAAGALVSRRRRAVTQD
jgi:hypothetical protein